MADTREVNPSTTDTSLGGIRLRRPFTARRSRSLLFWWTGVTVALVVASIVADITLARQALDQFADRGLHRLSDRVQASETAIEGFAAFAASVEEPEFERARQYAQTLLTRYDFLYRFEIAERVAGEARDRFERSKAVSHPRFRIRRFDFDTRSWVGAEDASFYYPLVFQEPRLDGAAYLIGLDISASEVLKAAMEASYERGQSVATMPFELAQGSTGYVLHRSIEPQGHHPPDGAFETPRYALLVVRGDQLLGKLGERRTAWSLEVVHRGWSVRAQPAPLLAIAADPPSPVASLFLPLLTEQRILGSASQPFELRVSWQLGLTDLNLGLLATIVVVSIVSFRGIRRYAASEVYSELTELEREGLLYEMANFDALTGLANRNRLLDFLESALARAKRSGQQFAVLFIDLDKFKPVNDRHGHHAGDLVLVEVANRLARQLRDGELIARYGGDEFVWVTSSGDGRPSVEDIIARMRREFATPLRIRHLHIALDLSVGCALYPRDGSNASALIEAADEAMYREKRAKALQEEATSTSG